MGPSSMSSPVSSLGSKLVVDADNRPVGRVAGSEVDPMTRDPVRLLVQIDPDQARFPDQGTPFCWLTYDQVRGIRREAIHLTDPLSGLFP